MTLNEVNKLDRVKFTDQKLHQIGTLLYFQEAVKSSSKIRLKTDLVESNFLHIFVCKKSLYFLGVEHKNEKLTKLRVVKRRLIASTAFWVCVPSKFLTANHIFHQSSPNKVIFSYFTQAGFED